MEDYDRRHAAQVRVLRRAPVDVLFLGDSLTANWLKRGPPPSDNLRQHFDRYFGHLRPGILAIGGDRTQHLLWRIDQGALDGLTPRLAVLLIGTNNLIDESRPPAETVSGIAAIAQRLLRELTGAHVLLLGILPTSLPVRERLAARVNARLAERYADVARVTMLEVGAALRGADGRADPALYEEGGAPDGRPLIHLNADGALRLASAIAPSVEHLVAGPSG